MSKPPTEVFTCSSCGARETVPQEYLRTLIARNREFVLEALRQGPMPEPARGALRFELGPPGPDGGRPPVYVTRNA